LAGALRRFETPRQLTNKTPREALLLYPTERRVKPSMATARESSPQYNLGSLLMAISAGSCSLLPNHDTTSPVGESLHSPVVSSRSEAAFR
jgi:hypothetical protein